MKGLLLVVVVGLVAFGAAPSRADDAPTKDQMDAAKKAYNDGKALHGQGKLTEAVDKFKESYRLSKNPLLLYNIGLTLDEAGQKDNALLYYRKFLSDAPPTASQRQSASDRVKELEKEKLDADLGGSSSSPPPKAAAVTTTPSEPEPKPEPSKPAKTVKIKPPGTYSASDFEHQLMDSAPPGKPLDITAFVPEDSGFTVTLYFRGAGDSQFTAKPMKWRHKELVARIPAAKMTGSAIQYYIEVKDQSGGVVTKSGKSADPNLISIEATAPTHYYSDLPDENSPVGSKHHEDEDPLVKKSTAQASPDESEPSTSQPSGETDTLPGQGFFDVGSKKFEYTKWGATGGAGLFLLGGIIFYAEASGQAGNLVTDSKSCGTPPCRPFDGYDQSVQSAGQRFQTLSNIGMGLTVVAAGVAGYYWYRELTSKKKHRDEPAPTTSSPDLSWIVVPSAGDGFTGAVAATRF